MNKTDYFIGKNLTVTRRDNDQFDHDFIGVGISVGKGFVQVRDQEDNVWDCDASQLTEEKVA